MDVCWISGYPRRCPKPSGPMMTGALWPHTQPSAALLAAYEADPALAAMRLDFTATIREVLQMMIAGTLARPAR